MVFSLIVFQKTFHPERPYKYTKKLTCGAYGYRMMKDIPRGRFLTVAVAVAAPSVSTPKTE